MKKRSVRARLLQLLVVSMIAGGVYWAYQKSRIITPDLAVFSGDVGGCGKFQVYRFNANRSLAIVVSLSEKNIHLPEKSELRLTLEEVEQGDLVIEVLQFSKRLTSDDMFFCTDVQPSIRPIARWKAISGDVVILKEQHPSSTTPKPQNATYRVSVRVENLILQKEGAEERVGIDAVDINEVWVGWYPG